jgi:hypothetical protein
MCPCVCSLKDLDLTELRRRMRGRISGESLESVVDGLHKASLYQKKCGASIVDCTLRFLVTTPFLCVV